MNSAPMTFSRGPMPQRERGFSLVELMIALVLGLVIVGGVISLFVNNQQAARANEGLGRLQENARVAFELMARELRQAGGNPCGATVTANTLTNPASNWWSDWDGGVMQGYDETQDTTTMAPFGTNVGERLAGTHAVRVLSGGMFNGSVITGHDTGTRTISLNTPNHGLAAGDIAVVCDGESSAIVPLSAVTGAPNGTVRHQTVADLGFPLGSPKIFQANGLVTRYTANFWYVGNNARGGTSLFRVDRSGVRQEVADGVTNLQAAFLTRDQSTGNLANDWVAASSITDWSEGAANLPVAVRLTVSLRTVEAVGTNQAPLQRQMFHVINLRNRPAPP